MPDPVIASAVCAPRTLGSGEYYGLVSGRRVVSDYVLSEIEHRQERKLPIHSHASAYFSLLLDGSYSESFAGNRHDYRPLTIWWHRAGIVHQDEIGSGGGRFFNLELAQSAMQSLAQARARADFSETRTRLVWLACRLLHEFRRWQPCSPLVVEGISLEMTAFTLREDDRRFPRSPAWLRQVVEKLNDEYGRNHTSAELAGLANVHPVYLASVFRRTYRETIGDHLRRIRVDRAAGLLLETALPLAEIAHRLGFSDQSHLTRNFKRIVGIPPGAFRALPCPTRRRPGHSRVRSEAVLRSA